MCVSACGKLPSMRRARGIVLLGQQPHVVARGEQALEQSLAFVVAVRAGPELSASQNEQGRNVPSPGGSAVDAGVGRVAQHEAVDHQLALDGLDGAAHARIVGRQEAHLRNQEQAGVQMRRAVRLHERVASRVEARAQTCAWIASRTFRQRSTGPSSPKRSAVLDRAVERHPRHHLGVSEVAPRPAHLPDALVGLLPVRFQEFEQGPLDPPRVRLRLQARARAPGAGCP